MHLFSKMLSLPFADNDTQNEFVADRIKIKWKGKKETIFGLFFVTQISIHKELEANKYRMEKG